MKQLFPFASPFTLLDRVNLVGDALIRAQTLILPEAVVRNLLPDGLTLLPQNLTPPGTHPLVLFFQRMIQAHMTIPTVLPILDYWEHVVGVPFTTSRSDPTQHPCLYMPVLFLNDAVAVVGGRLFWGFTKRLGTFACEPARIRVSTIAGAPLSMLDYEPTGDESEGGVDRHAHFHPMQQIMSMPLVSYFPYGEGPMIVFSSFDKRWDKARVRPLRTSVTVAPGFLAGLSGRYPREGLWPSVAEAPLGSFEVRARFRQSLVRQTAR